MTPKGAHGGWPSEMVLPLLPLTGFNLTAVGLAVASLVGGGAARPEAVIFAMVFATFFGVSGSMALVHTFERRQTDDANVLPVDLAATFRSSGEDEPLSLRLRRLGHDRAYALIDEVPRLPERARGRMSIPAVGLGRSVEAIYGGAHDLSLGRRRLTVLSFRLHGLGRAERDRIDHFGFEIALPRFFGAEDVPEPTRPDDHEPDPRPARSNRSPDPDYLPIESTLV